MKISGLPSSQPIPESPNNIKSSASADSGRVNRTGVDAAELGPVSSGINSLMQADESRVEALRAQYLSGSYRVDAKALSAKIVSDHLQDV
jgi:anti-sigma28 factor (negative regulator of flagellin synthesis)